jgi:hypothetical protein
MKDEIKKNTFEMTVDTGSWVAATQTFSDVITITDDGTAEVENGLKILKISETGDNVGILDRFNGIAAIQLSASFLRNSIDDSQVSAFVSSSGADHLRSWNYNHSMVSGTIVEIADAWRHRIESISVRNSTQLNVTTYLCHIGSNEFNYSSNPSYINTSSQVRVMLDGASPNINNPAYAYATGIHLYSADNEILASAKFSIPQLIDGKPKTVAVKLTG